MEASHNVFISHLGEDDNHVQNLKQRLGDLGYNIRNSSIDSTKHKDGRIPSKPVIERLLRRGINWAGTFICLIGPETHSSAWVNYEINEANRLGKRIVGVFLPGVSNDVTIPHEFKKYGGATISWNSLDKLGDAMDGKDIPAENPDGTPRLPIYKVSRIRC
jgi:hypothetical protein